jgi:hypothetical protein
MVNDPLGQLFWLEDAPLFTDSLQIDRFYDAVASPEGKQKSTTLEITDETVEALKGKFGVGVSISTLIAFIKPTVKASAEAEKSTEKSKGKKIVLELESISTPQRQLKQLALHFLVNHTARVSLVEDASEASWRDQTFIAQVPRPLVFLSLPGAAEASARGLPATKLIPMAAEFSNGSIVPLFEQLKFSKQELPRYPEKLPPEAQKQFWKEYWSSLDLNFSANKAIIAVEKAATKNGRIRWIDYRLPVSKDGSTIHLHVCPSGEYDTGVFAYNLIKRGFKHGIRVVGTLKSEPDINVLAIYER